MKHLFIFAKHLYAFRLGVYLTSSLVQQYFQSCCFYCHYVAAVTTVFLDFYPVGRAAAELEILPKKINLSCPCCYWPV